MPEKYQQFTAAHPETMANKPLAPLTTIKIGGPADLFYELDKIEELPDLIQTAKKLNIPYFILGGGSNLIFHEKGFRGLIIHIKAKTITVENETIIADAGALLSQVLQTALKNNLVGMEKLTGLPGTVGGAVRGNAGAFGIEIKDVFHKALIYNEEKGMHEEPASYFKFKYRSSTVKKRQGKDIILRVHFQLKKGDAKSAMKENAAIIASRLTKQPHGTSTGSFFKNPDPQHPAGKLLDEAGCKGLRVGSVQVSNLHANWITNLGSATQTDVITLMKTLQKRVKERFNITLEPEVQFVGDTSPINRPTR
ncbi:UDP-N-acetylmuramate dehydrogenase [Patescibacteria group bacterium]|nr:UDP-N-acetylmuramate dehydrogenase [Patescibacteria group bacterium]